MKVFRFNVGGLFLDISDQTVHDAQLQIERLFGLIEDINLPMPSLTEEDAYLDKIELPKFYFMKVIDHG